MDGWVSLEVSPDLAHDATMTVAEAVRLHAQAERPNLFIKIPGTPEGIDAIEESIFRGVPVNVTLLFSCQPVPRRRGGLPARHRTADRRRPRPRRPLGRLVVRLTLGRCRRRDAAARAAQPSRHRHRNPDLRRLPRAARLRAVAAPARRRRQSAAAAVREHRHQGPGRVRRPLRRGAGGGADDQHDAGHDAARLRRPRARA